MTEDYLLSLVSSKETDEVVCVDKFMGDSNLESLIAKLKVLDISKNKIILRGNCLSSNAGKTISYYLKDNKSVEFLSLEWNQIGSGVKDIAEALITNHTLQHLDLRNNSIADDEVISLSKILARENDTLKVLDLRWNQLTDKGVEMFRQAVMNRSPPLIVHFSGNRLSPQIMNAIEVWNTQQQQQQQQDENRNISNVANMQPLSTDLNKSALLGEMMDNSDILTQQKIYQQTKIQNIILHKEIQSLRQQTVQLQTIISSLENQLCTSAYTTTELQTNLFNKDFKLQQLMSQIADLESKLRTYQEESTVMSTTYETDKIKYTQEYSTMLRSKENEIMNITKERDTLREIITQMEISHLAECDSYKDRITQYDAEQHKLDDELRKVTKLYSDLKNEEIKFKAENTHLSSTITRLQEKLVCIEEEALLSQQHAEESLLCEMKRHDHEIDTIRNEITNTRNIYEQRIEKLMEEMTVHRNKYNENEYKLSQEIINLQIQYDKRLLETRQNEEERYSSAIKTLQTQLELSQSIQAEKDNRCNQYIKEIQKYEEDMKVMTKSTQSQITTMETEVTRLSQTMTSLQEELIQLKKTHISLQNTYDEIQSKYKSEVILHQEKHQLYSTLLYERDEWLQKYKNLNEEYQRLVSLQSTHMTTIEETIKDSITREIDKLKAKFLTPIPTSDIGTST